MNSPVFVRPSAVIFDMDGVIFDSENMVVLCWKMVADKYNIPDIETACRSCLGLNYNASMEWFLNRYGKDFPYTTYKAEMSALFHERCSGGRLPIKKGVVSLLEALRELGIPCAVASSTRQEVVVRELTDGGLFPYFDHVICGDMVSKSKPDPEIFLKAASFLGVSPANAIVIEDSFNGIRAAHAGGFRPIMVPDQVQPTQEIAALTEQVLPSLCEVEALIRSTFV